MMSLMVSTCVLETKELVLRDSDNRIDEYSPLVVLLRELEVVVTLLELEEQNDLVVADKLEARDAEVRVKRQVRLLGLGANMLARTIILKETRRVLDDAGRRLEALAMLQRAVFGVLVQRDELTVDVASRALSTVAKTHFE